jgi:hypothetical protein
MYCLLDARIKSAVVGGSRSQRRRHCRGAQLQRVEDKAEECPLDPFLLSPFHPSVRTEEGEEKGGGKSGREFRFLFFLSSKITKWYFSGLHMVHNGKPVKPRCEMAK